MMNRKSGKVSAVPRHREINEFPAQKICRDLENTKAVERSLLIALAHSLREALSGSDQSKFLISQAKMA